MANSVLFSFSRVDDFLELMIDDENITTHLFDGVTKNFRIILAETCPSNINDCLNADGTLKDEDMEIIIGAGENDGACALLWSKGVNGNRTIQIADSSVTFDLDDNTYLLKGAFLVLAQTGKVLCYSINNAPMSVTDTFTAPLGGMVWSIVNKIYEG